MISLCQTVKELKNNKDKNFDSLFDASEKELEPFTSVGRHLKYFYWYYKWNKEVKLSKKTILLDEGI